MSGNRSIDLHRNVADLVPASVQSTIDETGAYHSAGATGPYGAAPPGDAPVIPGYRLVAEIAHGGMGRVWAGHDLTLDREVAIKTLLPGAHAERFIVEAKITAQLPHPGIPPVHAMGTLADGMPYLAMKLIRGRTLAELLKERPSPAHELPRFVQIFEQIAQAVGFAHAQGIIHRDLKPLNVMVGAFGEVQVMDWGLAKSLSIADKEAGPGMQSSIGNPRSEITGGGTILGTPGYMAPEQARGEAVDARADVFALGSILATILTGQPAFVGTSRLETIEKTANAQVSEVLGRLDTSGADAELLGLAKQCLATRAEDRPADARVVAEQVSSYRAGVDARLQKAQTERAEALVREAEQRRRRRILQWAGGVIAAVLLLGVAGTTVGMVRADLAAEQERLAKEEEKKAKEQTERRLAQIEKGVELFAGMLHGINPRVGEQGGDALFVQLRKRAEQAADQLDAEAVGDPLAVARLQTILGDTLAELGNAAKAVVVLEKALATREHELGADHPDTLTSRSYLARAYKDAGQLGQALPLYEAALKTREATLGPDHHDTLATRNNLATAYQAAGQRAKALPLLEATLKTNELRLGPDHPDTLFCRNNLAVACWDAGQRDKSLSLLETTVKALETKLGADHPTTLTSRNNLAAAYQAAGQAAKAVPLFEATVKAFEVKLGADHPKMLLSRNNLAQAYQNAGQLDKALPLYEATLKAREAKLGADHPDTLISRGNLAGAYEDAGRRAEALPLYEATVKAFEAKLGADHPNTLTSRNNLALAYKNAGQFAKAIPLYEVTFKATEAKLGADHPDTLASRNKLALAYHAAGQLDKAIPLFEQAAVGIEKHRFQHEDADTILGNTIGTYEQAREFDKAEGWRRKRLARVRETTGTNSSAYATELLGLGQNLRKQQKWADAEAVLRECHGIREKQQPDAWTTFNTQSLLGAALLGQARTASKAGDAESLARAAGLYQEAEPLLLRGYEGMQARQATIPPKGRGRVAETLQWLIQLYRETNRPDTMAKWQRALAGWLNEELARDPNWPLLWGWPRF